MGNNREVSATSVQVHGSVADIAAEWDALAERLGATPFGRPGWMDAWLTTYAVGNTQIYAARRGGELVGVLPLLEQKTHRRSPTNWHSPRFEPLAVDADAAAALTRAALGSRRLSLSFVEAKSGVLEEMIRTARNAGYAVHIREEEESPEVPITGTWEEYFPTISKNMRREFKRRQKRLADAGEVAFEMHDGSDELERYVEEAFAVEALSWKTDTGTAVAVEKGAAEFYLGLARWAASRGWLRICFLRLDGKAIASDFGLEHDGVFYSMKGGYDPAFGEFSPGRLMDGLELQRAHEIGLRRFEFMGDAQHHKMQWRPEFRPLTRFEAFASTPAGRLEQFAAIQGKAALKRLRDTARSIRSRRPTSSSA